MSAVLVIEARAGTLGSPPRPCQHLQHVPKWSGRLQICFQAVKVAFHRLEDEFVFVTELQQHGDSG